MEFGKNGYKIFKKGSISLEILKNLVPKHTTIYEMKVLFLRIQYVENNQEDDYVIRFDDPNAGHHRDEKFRSNRKNIYGFKKGDESNDAGIYEYNGPYYFSDYCIESGTYYTAYILIDNGDIMINNIIKYHNTDVEELLKSGVDPNFIDKHGAIPLHYALQHNITAIELLISYGADVNLKDTNSKTPIDVCLSNMRDAIHMDAIHMHYEQKDDIISYANDGLRILLKHGATDYSPEKLLKVYQHISINILELTPSIPPEVYHYLNKTIDPKMKPLRDKYFRYDTIVICK